MKSSDLFRLAGAAAALGGALRIAGSFIPYMPDSDALEWLYLATDICLLFGLFGIYLAQSERIGWIGFIGFLLASSGVALIVGPDGALSGVPIYQAGVAMISIGLAIMSVAMLLARSFTIVVPLTWIGSLAVGLAQYALPGSPYPFLVGGVLFGVGFLIAGIGLAQRAP